MALLAHNASRSMTKGFRFAFLGTGLTGTFGEVWEILTIMSALHLWQLDFTAAAFRVASYNWSPDFCWSSIFLSITIITVSPVALPHKGPKS